MFEISWKKGQRTLTLDLPVDGLTMAKLDRVLGLDADDWRSTEAVLVLSEFLAEAVGQFAALKAVPPTNQQLYTAAKAIGATRVVIPRKAIRDREAMRDFLAAHGPRGDLPASFVLGGKPIVEVLPQHPIVMKRLRAAGAIRTPPTKAMQETAGSTVPTRRTAALKARLGREVK